MAPHEKTELRGMSNAFTSVRPRGADAPAKVPTKPKKAPVPITYYLWPETLPQATADRVAGVVARMAAKPARKAKEAALICRVAGANPMASEGERK